MKGLVLLFFAITGTAIGWNMAGKADRKAFVGWLRRNLWSVAVALAAVALAILFSANTTLRLL